MVLSKNSTWRLLFVVGFGIFFIANCSETSKQNSEYRRFREFMEMKGFAAAIAEALAGREPNDKEFLTDEEKRYLRKVVFLLPPKHGYKRCEYKVVDPDIYLVRFNYYNLDNTLHSHKDISLKEDEFWLPVTNLAARHAHKGSFPTTLKIMANIENLEYYIRERN